MVNLFVLLSMLTIRKSIIYTVDDPGISQCPVISPGAPPAVCTLDHLFLDTGGYVDPQWSWTTHSPGKYGNAIFTDQKKKPALRYFKTVTIVPPVYQPPEPRVNKKRFTMSPPSRVETYSKL